MKASDTVMTDSQLVKLCQIETAGFEIFIPNPLARDIAKAQAEISFKGGYEQGIEECLGDKAYDQIKQEGIKEVVEWIETKASKHSNGKLYVFIENEWQSKLKEWGIVV